MNEGRNGGWGRRPGVYTTEGMTPTQQFLTPILKTWVGVPGSIIMAGLCLVWALWLTPPNSALLVAVLVLACFGVYAGFLGLHALTRRDKEKAGWALLVGVSIAILIALVATRQKTWWGMDPKTWRRIAENIGIFSVQWVFALGGIAGGAHGVYWFRKETVMPHEPTGADYVNNRRLDFDKEKYYNELKHAAMEARIIELQEEVNALEFDLMTAKASPLVNAAEVSKHQRSHYLWQLAVCQMLLAGEINGVPGHTQGTWCPGGMTEYTLPLTSTKVPEAMVKHVYRAMRQLKVGDLAVMTSRSNKTFFTLGVPPLLAVGAIIHVPVWKGFTT